MTDSDTKPTFHFLRKTPDQLMSRPPLCSSLQNLESSFCLIELGRFPHALVMCASAIESAMKSALCMDSRDRTCGAKLYKKATQGPSELMPFDHDELASFREARNHIVHYGFSPQDNEETAILWMKTGYPFLQACYRELFGFDLMDSLWVELGEQLGITLDVYAKAKDVTGLNLTHCFLAFRHLLRWSARQSLMSGCENDASVHAEKIGAKFHHCEKEKYELELTLGTTWAFDCPVCRASQTFVCELNTDFLDEHVISLKRGSCPSCELVVPNGCPFLVDALCQDQITEEQGKILRDFGIVEG